MKNILIPQGLGGVATKYLLFSLGKSVMDICHEK